MGNGIHRWLCRPDCRDNAKVFIVFDFVGSCNRGIMDLLLKALSIGDVNKVVPIDKSSTVLSVLLAILLFHETEHLAVKLISTVLLGVGIILMVEKKEE